MGSEPSSSLWDNLAKGLEERRAEHIRETVPISRWSHLYDDFNYSPMEFFRQVSEELVRREVPGVLQGLTMMRESGLLSRKRLYLHIRRERFVFEICAAPFGTAWFVSSRLFDRRRGAKWFDFMFVAVGLGVLAFLFLAILGIWLTVALVGTGITSIWSVMRLAASRDATSLDDRLCDIPCLGRIYETLFHPETYFREDQRAMYQEAVHRSVMKALSDLTTLKGIRPLSDSEAKPAIYDLHRR